MGATDAMSARAEAAIVSKRMTGRLEAACGTADRTP
jgi:hypothetical protein